MSWTLSATRSPGRFTSFPSYRLALSTSHLHRRFEEFDDDETVALVPVPKDSKKRAREADDGEDAEPKLSKKDKKKQKKLKAENGEAVPTGEETTAEPKADKKKEKKEKKEDKAKKPQLPDPKVLAGGVKVADNKVGSGPAAKAGDRVSVRYVGKLQNGTIFDSNTKGKPV